MSTMGRHHCVQPIDAPGGATEPAPLTEAIAHAWLRSLCHKLQTADELHNRRPLDFWRSARLDVLAEMIGDLAGRETDEIYELFNRSGCTAQGLLEQLVPLPTDARSLIEPRGPAGASAARRVRDFAQGSTPTIDGT